MHKQVATTYTHHWSAPCDCHKQNIFTPLDFLVKCEVISTDAHNSTIIYTHYASSVASTVLRTSSLNVSFLCVIWIPLTPVDSILRCILVQCSAFLASGSDPTDDSRRKRIEQCVSAVTLLCSAYQHMNALTACMNASFMNALTAA